jgi:ATP synthase protein I
VAASTQSIISAVYRVIFYQLLIMIGFVLMVFILKNIKSGWSALAGGLAYWLPTFIFVRSVAACAGAHAVRRFIAAFFGGEVIKLVLSGVLFIMAVNYLHVETIYAVLGLSVAIIAFWLAFITYFYQSKVMS